MPSISPPQKPQARIVLGSQRYWLCHLAGWGGMFVFSATLILVVAGGSPEKMWADVRFLGATSLMGLLATHGLRGIMLAGRWLELESVTFVKRIATAWLVLTISLAALGGWLFATPSPSDPAYVAVLPGVMMNATLLGAWLAIYWLVHVYADREQSRIDHERLRSITAESQLAALQSQLQPHFLFNCLNTIRSLTPPEAKHAREAITMLADLLRACLRDGQARTQFLSRELELTRLYLHLEKARFGGMMSWSESIAPETRGYLMPSLLLLTLVENAVKHGVLRQADGGSLSIVSRSDGSSWTLRVESPGSFSSMPGSEESLGLGLRNATERLRLIFGHAASFQLTSRDECVVAEVTLPLP